MKISAFKNGGKGKMFFYFSPSRSLFSAAGASQKLQPKQKEEKLNPEFKKGVLIEIKWKGGCSNQAKFYFKLRNTLSKSSLDIKV
jgi:hypothetical protein